jgi:serine/threonine protein phosphatase PrpC
LGQPGPAKDVDVNSEATLACWACQAQLLADDRYCEQCGTRTTAEPSEEPSEEPSGEPSAERRAEDDRGNCGACEAPAEAISADGYCTRCGVRQRTPRDRQEIDVVVAAGVSDRGRVHHRNEDALHLETVGENGVVVVICDGISSSVSPDLAARSAAEAAGGVLANALRSDSDALSEATANAIHAAQEAVLGVPWTPHPDRDAPSCTLVSAACHDGELAIGWVGDSRAYWIAEKGSRQLTVDDSWAQEQVTAGLMSAVQAGSDRRAHSITRWLGADAPADPPQLLTLRPTEPGRLVLCSDGLWNYAPDATDIATLLDALPSGASALAAAHSLIDTALAAGGRDNITVAVIDIRPPRRDHI